MILMQTVKVPTDELIQVVMMQIETGGVANLTVTGFSMMPLLRHLLDTVILIPVPERLKSGDMALFQRDNGQYIMHRVIRVTKDGYLFCGDNQSELEPVRHDQVIAFVNGFIKKGKRYFLIERSYRFYTAACIYLFWLRKPYIAIRRRFGRIRARLARRRKKQ